MLTFQQIILNLQDYWGAQGCALLQPYDMEVGAGTSHTATFLRALGPEPWKAAYVQPSRRPKDGRYGENPNRLQHYYQYQVVLKPAPANILELYLGSLEALGFDLKANDVRFVEDDWENPTLGCWGLGWEVWLNGMEVTQFTYFQQVGGIDCKPITGEITYGLERLAMYLQGVDNVYDLTWTDGLSYGDVYQQNEVEQSTYNFEHSDVEFLLSAFGAHEKQSKYLMEQKLALPAYEQLLKAGAQLQPARRARRDQRDRARRRTSAASATWRARSRRAISTAARGSASRWRRRPGPTKSPRSSRRRRHDDERRKNLLVELFVEELPPKALKKLGEAFASALADEPEGAGPRGAMRRSSRRSRRRAAWPRTSRHVERASRRQGRVAEADAGQRRPRRRGRSDAGTAEEARERSAPMRRRCRTLQAPDRRQGRGAVLRQRRHRRDACRRPAEGARRGAREAADPEGDAVPARRRLDQRELRAPGARPRRAARRRRRAGRGARPARPAAQTHGHRFEAQRRSDRAARRRHYAEQLARRKAR